MRTRQQGQQGNNDAMRFVPPQRQEVHGQAFVNGQAIKGAPPVQQSQNNNTQGQQTKTINDIKGQGSNQQ